VRSGTPDSNLYISALIWGGKPQQLLEIALARKVRLFISDAIMDEVLEVLETKFNHSPKRLALEKEYIGKCTVRCVPKVRLDVVKDDPDDNRILECAVHSRSEAIITHDKDLLRMKSYQGIRMMKVNEFLREERGLSR
jgi:putative PIN family toxin of toxin-antitoxin system